ncbi:virion structural protein [Rhodobacteraceae phage LS06-2018-MD05]|nr:virion structural protein [Rhodobacteraceae phage LS06-2018-MD05]
MTDKKKSQLLSENPVSTFTGNETGDCVQGGINKGFLYSTLKSYVAGDYMPKATYDPDEIEADVFDSANTKYDNSTSGMTADDVQAALDEAYEQSLIANAGAITEPTFTDNGDGTVTVGNVDVRFYDNVNYTGAIKEFTVSGDTFTLVDSLTQLNYIVADYNSGSPILKLINSATTITGGTIQPIFSLARSGTDICKLEWNSYGLGYAEKAFKKDVELNRFSIKDGLAITETGTRNLVVASGNVYYGTKLATLNEVDTSGGDDICFFYHVAGVYTESNATQYNNTQYDNGTALATLSNNKYAVNWIWRNVDENKDRLCMVLGGGNYSLAEAENSSVPVAPVVVSGMCVLVGRVIVEKNATTATAIELVSDVKISTAGVINHDDTANKGIAASGVTYGHVTDQAQTFEGDKNFSGKTTLEAEIIAEDIFRARDIEMSDKTASTILHLDSSKEINSLPTSTYPSLAELAYVKGVTSAIQTQMDKAKVKVIQLSCSDLTTDLTTGTSKAYLRMPYAMTLTEVRASVLTAPTGAALTIDINESGTTILSTKITIDATEKTSETAATAPVISDSSLADDAEITIDIDQVGSTIAGKGLIVTLIGYKS